VFESETLDGNVLFVYFGIGLYVFKHTNGGDLWVAFGGC